MPQTMLALLAMMLVGLYSVNQSRRAARINARMIRNEVESIAESAAMDRLEHIGTKAYDEATKDDDDEVGSAGALTAAPFAPDTPDDDIDDFHESSQIDTVQIGSHVLRFKVYTTVSYAQESDPNMPVAGGTKTKYKRVRASVQSLTVPLPDSMAMYRSYACGARCAW